MWRVKNVDYAMSCRFLLCVLTCLLLIYRFFTLLFIYYVNCHEYGEYS